MSVKIRPYRRGGWEVDITVRLSNGTRFRERSKAPVSSKVAAHRWGENRERHLALHGPRQTDKEAPTLEQFACRFIEGHARANRQKPSGIAAKETILKVHLIPQLGSMKLSAITTEDVQRLKSELKERAPKTVNNVLTVLNTLLKKAVEWQVIERMPCTIRLLSAPRPAATFHDFDEYERLLKLATTIDAETRLIVLLGGEAGMRCGEMIALEWADVDLSKGLLCVQRSDWNGQVTVPKGGRLRYVPMSSRTAAALRAHPRRDDARVLCQNDGRPLTRQMVQYRVLRAARRANLDRDGVHVLRHTFCSHLAMRGAPAKAIQELAGHRDLSMTQRYMHLSPAALDAAIRLLDRPVLGDSLETEGATEEIANV